MTVAAESHLPAFPVSQGMGLRRAIFAAMRAEFGKPVSALTVSERGTLKSTECDLIQYENCAFLAERYGFEPTVLTIRLYQDELSQEMTRMTRLLAHIYGGDAARKMVNVKDKRISIPNVATFEYRGLADETDASKTLGKSYTGIRLEELTYLPPSVVSTARKALRAPAGPNGEDLTFVLASTNPWGPYASAWHKHFGLEHAEPMQFETDENEQPVALRTLNPLFEPDTNRMFLYWKPRLWENPWVTPEYVAELKAEPDPAKRAAHLFGEWRTAGGNMLEGVFSEAENCVHPWPDGRPSDDWALSFSYDHGTRQSHTFQLWATARVGTRCPNGWYYPAGSKVLIAEHHNADLDGNPDLSAFTMTVEQIADGIMQACKRFDLVDVLPTSGRQILRCPGVGDAAMWNDLGVSTIANEFATYGVRMRPSTKPPLRTRFAPVADLMRHARADESLRTRAGLYAARDCTYTLACFASLMRNPRDPEVWLSGGKEGSFDHPWDACCYHVLTRRAGFRVTSISDHIS